MAKISKHLLKSLREAKLALIWPMPAPEFDKAAMTADKDVLMSLCKANMVKVSIKKSAMNIEIKPHMDCKMGSANT